MWSWTTQHNKNRKSDPESGCRVRCPLDQKSNRIKREKKNKNEQRHSTSRQWQSLCQRWMAWHTLQTPSSATMSWYWLHQLMWFGGWTCGLWHCGGHSRHDASAGVVTYGIQESCILIYATQGWSVGLCSPLWQPNARVKETRLLLVFACMRSAIKVYHLNLAAHLSSKNLSTSYLSPPKADTTKGLWSSPL